MSDHPEDELISFAGAALTAAEVDAATGLRTYISPRMASNAQNSRTYKAKRAVSWASIVKDQWSHAGIHHDKPLPTTQMSPSAAAPTSPRSTASTTSQPTPGYTFPPQPKEAFDEVINHPFPRALGDGTASLDGFRHYMIQDWHYLKTCALLKMSALGSGTYSKEIEEFDVRYKVEYMRKLEEICSTMLGVPKSAMEATPRSVQLDTTERFYKKALQDDNAWLGYYIILLPCVLTYWKIAERLMHDPSTAKNVVYHRAWTVVNYDDSSVGKYIKFINANIAAKGGVDQWNWTFNLACLLEAKLFDTGLKAPTPFEIIPDGTYSIYTSSAKDLVLGVRDVTSSSADKSLVQYLPSDARSSIVGMEKTGGDHQRWHVCATKAGYTFKNLATGLYLGIPTAQKYRVLQAVLNPYCWWINPSSSQPNEGPSVYQIHDSVNLRFTLHAAIEALNDIASAEFPFVPVRYICGCEQLQKAEAMIKQLEAEGAGYMEENNLLRKELEEARSALDELKIPASTKLPITIGKLRKQLAEQHVRLQETRERESRKREHASPFINVLWVHTGLKRQICYWEPLTPGAKFDSTSFDPPLVEFSRQNGRPTFVTAQVAWKCQSPGPGIHLRWLVTPNTSGLYQVFLGDSSRLSWIPIDEAQAYGPPKVKSLNYKPVTGWDTSLGKYDYYPAQVYRRSIASIGSLPSRYANSRRRILEVLRYNPSETV
ncbi:hypothetical protein B0H16DRAFT_1713131 [Mycena metata]|uniref:Thiaminase-2/PQQC domain-containing protein n=1 Tax=Mycena metata TaxID=1033252 RepID=A0AAD7K0B4_9AGAR|nr:hypothetical protein B0H16DRAFT_1713131 [Mycena metata]